MSYLRGGTLLVCNLKVIGAQGLGPLGDRTKRALRHQVPEESTTKQPNQIQGGIQSKKKYFGTHRDLNSERWDLKPECYPLHHGAMLGGSKKISAVHYIQQCCLKQESKYTIKLNFSKNGVTLPISKIGDTLDILLYGQIVCCGVVQSRKISLKIQYFWTN